MENKVSLGLQCTFHGSVLANQRHKASFFYIYIYIYIYIYVSQTYVGLTPKPMRYIVCISVLLLLLLLLSRFSHVRLCATPWTEAHQIPPSLGFSRQEHWSGLPFPSLMHESKKWKGSHSVISDSSRPHGLQPTSVLGNLKSQNK